MVYVIIRDGQARVRGDSSGPDTVTPAGRLPGYVSAGSDMQLKVGCRYLVDTTAPRVLSLPALNGLPPGQAISIADGSGLASNNSIRVVPAAGDAMIGGAEGGTVLVIGASGASGELVVTPDGWRFYF